MKVLAVAVGFVFTFPMLGQVQGHEIPITNPQLVNASKNLKFLVQTNPFPGVSTDLKQWLESSKVFMSFQSDALPETCETEIVRVNYFRLIPTLVCNPVFLTKYYISDPGDDKLYKYLVVYHEYIHLREHLAGRIRLLEPEEVKKNPKLGANNLWDSEFAATRAEWEQAKKMGVQRLYGVIAAEVQKFGEQKGFLMALHTMLMGNFANLSSVPEEKAFLENRYQMELAKIGRVPK